MDENVGGIWRRLSATDAALLDAFACDTPGGEELVNYLRNEALGEQQANLAATFLFLSEQNNVLDAYVTLSATGVQLPEELRVELQTERGHIPSVMIDYIAVANHRRGTGLGREIFEWVQDRAARVNATAGVRLIFLGVRAANWAAYRIYVRNWGFTPLPVKRRDPPDPDQPKPEWLADDVLIHLFYDLVENNGPFEEDANLDE